MSRDAFAEGFTRSYLGQIENGRFGVGIETLGRIAKRLGVTPSQLLLITEARLAEEEVCAHAAASNERLFALVKSGKTDQFSPEEAAGGSRLVRANITRSNVQRLQREGLSKQEVVRQLSVARRTVDRYWVLEPEDS